MRASSRYTECVVETIPAAIAAVYIVFREAIKSQSILRDPETKKSLYCKLMGVGEVVDIESLNLDATNYGVRIILFRSILFGVVGAVAGAVASQ